MNQLINFDEKNKVFHLHNDQISYLLAVEDGNTLAHVYFGKTIKQYHGQLRYPRVDRGFSGNLPSSLDRTFSRDSLPKEYSTAGSRAAVCSSSSSSLGVTRVAISRVRACR